MEKISPFSQVNGAFLINKHAGVSSFGVIELLQKSMMEHSGLKRRDLPKLGHGGTLDPFATGLLAVCAGRAVKLARYFLGSTKTYEGTIRFGETTPSGDPTTPVTEEKGPLPESIEALRELAHKLTGQPYLQTPPMFSAKKKDGKPLYELAREGLEVEREPKLCHLYSFEILEYQKPHAKIRVVCSSGTYIRTLAMDFARMLGTVALLETLDRTATGVFRINQALTLDQMREAIAQGTPWESLPCFVPFDELLGGYERASATPEEAQAIFQGRQNVLFNILSRADKAPRAPAAGPIIGQDSCLAIYQGPKLIAIARKAQDNWALERVFTPED